MTDRSKIQNLLRALVDYGFLTEDHFTNITGLITNGNGISGTINENLVLLKNQHIDQDESYVTIDFPHHEVHEGNSFNVCSSVAAEVLRSVSFKTSNGKRMHLVINYNTESSAHIELKEGVTITATTGTEQAVINRDRNSGKKAELLSNKSGAWLASNMVLIDATVGGGSAILTKYSWTNKDAGTQLRGSAEWILKEDTEYEILLTSDDGAKGLDLELSWYEHTQVY